MDWISNHAWETWLIVAVALAALELVSLDLILVMLAGGALLGAVVALFGAAFAVQVLVALAASVGLLALVRPNVVRRLHNGPHLRTGTEALIGRQALVLREMSAHHPGRVKIGGEEWSAAPYSVRQLNRHIRRPRAPSGGTPTAPSEQGGTTTT
jgi:membrane protein implicated in regulation of membrane protease activity